MAICQNCVCHAIVEEQYVLGVHGYRIRCPKCNTHTSVYQSLDVADDVWYALQMNRKRAK